MGAIVAAAGRGERLGAGAPKALREVGRQPMLVHAVRALAASALVDIVVVAAPESAVDDARALLAGREFGAEVFVVAGGASRQDSVLSALTALPPDVDVVLVHDAARPFAPSRLADHVVRAVRGGRDAVIPVLPVTDTIKRVDDDGRVLATVGRADLRAVQTPQGFRRDLLAAAHEVARRDGYDATDDAGLVERLGVSVYVVVGSDEAFKITRPMDLLLAQMMLDRRDGAASAAGSVRAP